MEVFSLIVPKSSVGGTLRSFVFFRCQKSLCKRGEYQKFPSKVICLTVPKISVGVNPLVLHYFRVPKKNYASVGYVTTFDFLSHNFCLTVPKCFVGEPCVLCFRKFPIAKNFMDRRRGVSRLPVAAFCLTVPKDSVGGNL